MWLEIALGLVVGINLSHKFSIYMYNFHIQDYGKIYLFAQLSCYRYLYITRATQNMKLNCQLHWSLHTRILDFNFAWYDGQLSNIVCYYLHTWRSTIFEHHKILNKCNDWLCHVVRNLYFLHWSSRKYGAGLMYQLQWLSLRRMFDLSFVQNDI